MMHDLADISTILIEQERIAAASSETYSNPICECTTRRAQRIESVTGLKEPAANGAIVKGIRPAEMILSSISSWYFNGQTPQSLHASFFPISQFLPQRLSEDYSFPYLSKLQ
jgi:hypothetical protein